jgi:hypothetical protein
VLDHIGVVKIDIPDKELRERSIGNLPSLIGIDILSKFTLNVTGHCAYLDL